MAKKSRRKQARSKKWNRANTMNFVAGVILAVSMILGSVLVFGSAAPSSSPQITPTPIVTTTTVPAVGAGATLTPVTTPTP